MRFKTFLGEQDSLTFSEVVRRIKAECGPYLASHGEKFMIRGLPIAASKSIRFTDHPQHRESRDSTFDFNLMFNAGIQLSAGIQNVRSTSYFTTGSPKLAREYGDINYIFPKGDFKFIWSDEVADSYDQESKIRTRVMQELEHISSAYKIQHGRLGFFNVMSFFHNAGKYQIPAQKFVSQTDDMKKIVSDILKKEMEETDAFIDLPNAHSDILRALERAFSKMYQMDDLDKAIVSGNEILIYESGGYYVIPLQKVDEAMPTVPGKGETRQEFLNSVFK